MPFEAALAKKLAELGLELPSAPEPKGVYRPMVPVGDLLVFTSGHLPITPAGEIVTGRLGEDLDVEDGYRAAMLAGLGILATLRKGLSSLNRVRRVLKVFGVVNGTDDFDRQPAVINGCSELLVDVFGEKLGAGARSAVGANALPLGAAVEIEAIFEVK